MISALIVFVTFYFHATTFANPQCSSERQAYNKTIVCFHKNNIAVHLPKHKFSLENFRSPGEDKQKLVNRPP